VRILIRNRNVELVDGGRERIERSLRYALGRFGQRVRRVTLGLADLNGPRGGVDKRCRVSVALEPRGGVFIEEDSADVFAAVDGAVERLARSVERKLGRDRELDGRAVRRGKATPVLAGLPRRLSGWTKAPRGPGSP